VLVKFESPPEVLGSSGIAKIDLTPRNWSTGINPLHSQGTGRPICWSVNPQGHPLEEEKQVCIQVFDTIKGP